MLRCSIRELTLLTALVAVGLGWWIDRSRLQAASVAAEAARTKAEAREAEFLKALVELDDAVRKRGFSTARNFGQKLEIVGPVIPAP